jgi:hypothetical protein
MMFVLPEFQTPFCTNLIFFQDRPNREGHDGVKKKMVDQKEKKKKEKKRISDTFLNSDWYSITACCITLSFSSPACVYSHIICFTCIHYPNT